MGTNLLQCFEGEHPKYPLSNETALKHNKIQARASSEATGDQDPPRVFVDTHPSRWIVPANAFLRSSTATTNPELSKGTMADPESAMAELSTEQDVVRVANHFLMYPIGKAINAKYTTKITQSTEAKQDRCRSDHSFNIHQDDKARKKTIMVVEFKRLCTIKKKEFTNATCKESEKSNALRILNNRGIPTAIEEDCNAYWYTKQATAYAQTWDCKYVALCDYETLVLLHFDDGLDSARITIVPRHSFRKALLGFLIEACEFAGVP